jgi:hypothetical protein
MLCATFPLFAMEHTYESSQYTGSVNLPLLEPFGEIGNAEKLVSLSNGNLGLGMDLGKLDIGNDVAYTIILGYNSGIPLNQQSTWVGLGFNINPGAILRFTKGVPDDKKHGSYQTLQWNYQNGEGFINQIHGGYSYTVFISKDYFSNPFGIGNGMFHFGSSGDVNSQGGASFGLSFGYGGNSPWNSPYPTVLTPNLVAVPGSSYGIAPGTAMAYGFSGPFYSGVQSQVYYKYGMMWEHLTTEPTEREYSCLIGEPLIQFGTQSPTRHRVFRTLNDVTAGTTSPSYAFNIMGESHDNYLVQGPAPIGVLLYDNSCQLILGSGPDFDVLPSPSDPNPYPRLFSNCGQKGFYYIARQSINSGTDPRPGNFAARSAPAGAAVY